MWRGICITALVILSAYMLANDQEYRIAPGTAPSSVPPERSLSLHSGPGPNPELHELVTQACVGTQQFGQHIETGNGSNNAGT
jgi:hypothetical protein